MSGKINKEPLGGSKEGSGNHSHLTATEGDESEGRRAEDAAKSEQRQHFGTWLRARRMALGMSQEKAAEEAKLSTNTWHRIEAGISGTRYSTVPRIAHAIQADLSETYRMAGFSLLEDRSPLAGGPEAAANRWGSHGDDGTHHSQIARQEMADFSTAALSTLMSAFAMQGQMIASLEARIARLEKALADTART